MINDQNNSKEIDTVTDKLEKLKKLLDQGLISETVYNEKQKEILEDF
jgi:hypothetical protein